MNIFILKIESYDDSSTMMFIEKSSRKVSIKDTFLDDFTYLFGIILIKECY